MNTEPQVAPDAATQIPASDQLDELETKTPEPSESKPEGDAQDERDKTIRKLQRRIDSRTRGLGERDYTIAQLRAELARVQEQQRTEPTDEPSDRRLPEDEIERRAEAKAQAAREAETVASRTKEMLAAGKAFDEFQDLAAEVAEDLPFLDNKAQPTPFIRALLDVDKPEMRAELMVHLARNPEVRDELAGLSERQMARKLALIEASIGKAPEKRSKAPKPIEPLNGNAKGDPDPSEMTDKQFAAWRRSQIASRR